MVNVKKYILDELKYKGCIGFYLYQLYNWLYILKETRGGDKATTNRRFLNNFGRNINWNEPKTLNEKIQWLKFNCFEDFHTVCADKYRMREYLYKKFGNNNFQIQVLYVTDNWKNITYDVIPDIPCVIKANHTQGDVVIVKNKKDVDIKKLRIDCRAWLKRNLYRTTFEPQYRHIKPLIVIEKLLQTKQGQLPNDYKLHYFNGNLEFVYCSVDREGINKRNIYDSNWNPLYFTWSEKFKDPRTLRGPEILAPKSFDKMKELASEIAKDFKYVRVDFYDIDGELYFGEITLHHGSGFDVFFPSEYDGIYGEKLKL